MTVATAVAQGAAMTDGAAIADRIEEAARVRSLSYRDLAKRAGMNPTQVGSIVYRMRTEATFAPSARSLRRIAEAAGVRVGWLVAGEGERDAVVASPPDAPLSADEIACVIRDVDPDLVRSLLRLSPAGRDALRKLLEVK